MSLEAIVNGERYGVIWVADKYENNPYYGVDTQKKLIFIYNTHDDYLTRLFIDRVKIQYRGMGK